MKKNKFSVDVFIEGDDIDLIVVDESLIEHSNWYRWFNDEKTNANTVYHIYPNSAASQNF